MPESRYIPVMSPNYRARDENARPDASLLTPEEQQAYAARRASWTFPALIILGVVGFFAVPPLVGSIETGSAATDSLADLVGVACYLAVPAAALMLMGWTTELRHRRSREYLKSIGYPKRARDAERDRAQKARRAERSDGGPTMSVRQQQRAWYGEGNRDLTWRDRVIGEQHGMDVDTYRNNFLERE